MKGFVVSCFLFLNAVIGLESLLDVNFDDKPELSSPTTSKKFTSVLRDILNQERLFRSIMLQKIRGLKIEESEGINATNKRLEKENVKLNEQVAALNRTLENTNQRLQTIDSNLQTFSLLINNTLETLSTELRDNSKDLIRGTVLIFQRSCFQVCIRIKKNARDFFYHINKILCNNIIILTLSRTKSLAITYYITWG
jgi:hypothetical protein